MNTKMKIVDKNIVLPSYELNILGKKKNRYLICIPVLNEGVKFRKQLRRMQQLRTDKIADLIICDGGSTDGSADIDLLLQYGVTALIIRKSEGHLSDQLMLGYYYAMVNGYQGTITIDGNGKDGVDGIKRMVQMLDQGYDFIQGSRFLKGVAGVILLK